MADQLTQKERMLLQDQLKHEELCIRKYTGYASSARNQDLRRMFNEIAADEQNHYNTINGFLMGGGASAGTGAGMGAGGASWTSGRTAAGAAANMAGGPVAKTGGQVPQATGMAQTGSAVPAADDAEALDDMLVTEKYISGSYDTAIFEAAHPQLRGALQQIQDDEQRHRERNFSNMNQHGMYRPQ